MPNELLYQCLGCKKLIDSTAEPCPHCGRKCAGSDAKRAVEQMSDHLIARYETTREAGYNYLQNLMNIPRPRPKDGVWGSLFRCVCGRPHFFVGLCAAFTHCRSCYQRFEFLQDDLNKLEAHPDLFAAAAWGCAGMEARLSELSELSDESTTERSNNPEALPTSEEFRELIVGANIDDFPQQLGPAHVIRRSNEHGSFLVSRHVSAVRDSVSGMAADVVLGTENGKVQCVLFLRDRIHDLIARPGQPAGTEPKLLPPQIVSRWEQTDLKTTRQFKQLVLGHSRRALIETIGKPAWFWEPVWFHKESEGIQEWRYFNVARKWDGPYHATLTVGRTCTAVNFSPIPFMRPCVF